VPATLDALLAALRPHAVALSEAFGYEQGHLRAAIASGAEQQRQDEARAATGV
jgi:acyl-CoA oxidase